MKRIEEVTLLYEISEALNAQLDLKKGVYKVLDILSSTMNMVRGTVTIVHPLRDEIEIEIAHGMSQSAMEKGKHVIRVCTGTACYVKGAPRILDAFSRELNVAINGMTEDKQFSLETVNCVGCCGQSPVVTVDEDIFGYVSQTMVQDVIGKYT